MENILKESIDIINVDRSIIDNLKNHDMNTIYDLCNHSRIDLVDIGLNNNQINKVSIYLQLEGLDLKPNHAKKNTIISRRKIRINKKL